MRVELRRTVRRGMFFALALLLVAALAGCNDDENIGTIPPGQGTIDSPYIVQAGVAYKDIPMAKGGTLFFIGQDVPKGWQSVNTTSNEDINLMVSGFENFFGDESGGSFTQGSGTEAYTVL